MNSKNSPSLIEEFWRSYQASLPNGHPHRGLSLPQAWGFGDSPVMADELGTLVLDGTKTATCSLLWEYEAEGESIPKPGDLSIILDGEGLPMCLIETVGVVVQPFDRVGAGFAYDEGEGDRSLTYWRAGHWNYFSKACAAIGKSPHPSMPVVCERFRLAWSGKTDSSTLRKLEKEQDMAEMKTKPTRRSPEEFLNSTADEDKRSDSFTLLEMMRRAIGEEAVMWGDSIVGFGSYHYRYQSGREGDMPVIAFSPRVQALTLYLMPGFAGYEELLSRLGKYKTGKACLYIKKLADVDKDVLVELIEKSVSHMRSAYPPTGH